MSAILFVASEDWLFALRHLPGVRAAREMGLEPVVAARERGHRRAIEQAGARFVPWQAGPAGFSPLALWQSVRQLRGIMRDVDPLIVQMHGPRPILAGMLAARWAGIFRKVAVLNGLGAMARRGGMIGDGQRFAARNLAGLIAGGPATRLVFDNPDDPALLGLDADDAANLTVLRGLGVDPLIHLPEPMPWAPPLKLAFGSPLLWANGPDLAVAALTRARTMGIDVTLSLIGAPVAAGRAAVPEATLRGWSRQPGINWFGPTPDVAQVWRQHHALILPSRGGDGLPSVLLQAASSGRPSLVSDVGGCRSFVRDGIDGRVAPAGDDAATIEALALAITEMARAPAMVERMGRAARENILMGGFTERDAMTAFKRIWQELAGTQAASLDEAA